MDATAQPRRVALVADTSFYVGPPIARLLAARGHDLVIGNPAAGLADELRARGREHREDPCRRKHREPPAPRQRGRAQTGEIAELGAERNLERRIAVDGLGRHEPAHQPRQRQRERFRNHPALHANSDMGVSEIAQLCVVSPEGRQLLELSVKRMQLGARAYHRVLKLSRTIADLGGSDRTVGFVIGTFSVVALASRFISGPLADRKGRKIAFLTGLVACGGAGLAYFLPLGIFGMYLGRGMHLEFRHPSYEGVVVTSPIVDIRVRQKAA